MWEVGAKQRNRPVRNWRNRSRVGLFRTVFVNAGGKPRVHLARNPSPAYAKSGRDRFDSWHFVRPFSLPSVEMWREIFPLQNRGFTKNKSYVSVLFPCVLANTVP